MINFKIINHEDDKLFRIHVPNPIWNKVEANGITPLLKVMSFFLYTGGLILAKLMVTIRELVSTLTLNVDGFYLLPFKIKGWAMYLLVVVKKTMRNNGTNVKILCPFETMIPLSKILENQILAKDGSSILEIFCDKGLKKY